MNIVHYAPKAKSIRFFRKIKHQLNDEFSDDPELIVNFWNTGEFMQYLRGRNSKIDTVIISAHGWKDSILKPYQGTFVKVISLSDTGMFKNKFVFANSCFTADKFGPKLIENGAFSFIGFNDTISNFFLTDNEYKLAMEKIFKKIYTLSISKSIALFIKRCLTVKEFTLLIDLNYRKNINSIIKMEISDINNLFQLDIPTDNTSFKKTMKLELLQKYNDLKNKLTLIGEENYIQWNYLKYLPIDKLQDRLNKVEFISESNILFKSMLKLIIYTCLNDEYNYLKSIEDFTKHLEQTDDLEDMLDMPLDIIRNFQEMKQVFAG